MWRRASAGRPRNGCGKGSHPGASRQRWAGPSVPRGSWTSRPRGRARKPVGRPARRHGGVPRAVLWPLHAARRACRGQTGRDIGGSGPVPAVPRGRVPAASVRRPCPVAPTRRLRGGRGCASRRALADGARGGGFRTAAARGEAPWPRVERTTPVFQGSAVRGVPPRGRPAKATSHGPANAAPRLRSRSRRSGVCPLPCPAAQPGAARFGPEPASVSRRAACPRATGGGSGRGAGPIPLPGKCPTERNTRSGSPCRPPSAADLRRTIATGGSPKGHAQPGRTDRPDASAYREGPPAPPACGAARTPRPTAPRRPEGGRMHGPATDRHRLTDRQGTGGRTSPPRRCRAGVGGRFPGRSPGAAGRRPVRCM